MLSKLISVIKPQMTNSKTKDWAHLYSKHTSQRKTLTRCQLSITQAHHKRLSPLVVGVSHAYQTTVIIWRIQGKRDKDKNAGQSSPSK
jgi:hypothetical protein